MNYIIIGAGISGKGAAQLLASQGFGGFIYDDEPLPQEELTWWQGLGFKPLSTTPPPESRFVLSPSIPRSHPLIADINDQQVLSEVDLALSFFKGQIIAVTGTNGKSTVVKMIEHILLRQGHLAVACGNIGYSVSEAVALEKPIDFLVVELSSFQLAISRPIQPDVGICLNISPDHLNIHGTFANYARAKLSLLQYSKWALMTPRLCSQLPSWGAALPKGRIQLIQDQDGDCLENPMTEKHNRSNAYFAATAATRATCQRSIKENLQTLSDFDQLPFRMKTSFNPSGYRLINDSKSTNLASTLAALESIDRKAVLVLGGIMKQDSFKAIVDHRTKIEAVVCLGSSREQLYNQLAPHLPTTKIASLSQLPAYARQHKNTVPILFSPGCSSLDEYANFEERGSAFDRIMNF